MKNMYGTSLLVASVLAAGGFTSMAMAQDECSTAVTAVIGANAFDTTSATTSPEPVDDTLCPGTFLDWGSANKDVWFSYTATQSGYLNLNTCLAGSFDTSVVVYTGSCGALTQIACNGDGVGLDGCQGFYSAVPQIEATAGTTYYIRVGGWTDADTGVSESGTGSLALNFQPVNAGCLGATGDCGLPHGTGGCDDPVCCSAVCDFDSACCDASWTADCVTYAVDLCGIFVYNCTGSTQANDCATNATVLSADTFRDINNNGANTDGPTHPGADCASGNDNFFNDLWYRVQAQANGSMTVQTCVVNGGPATTFDTKLAVYDMGTDFASFDYNTLPDALVGCNDDGDEACVAGGGVFPSLLSVNVSNGNWYLIRVATYDTPGTARVTFDFPEPCALPTQTGTEAEACGDDSNGGCNAGGPTESIAVGNKIKGSFWITDDGAGGLTRDLDWYQLNVTADSTVSINVYSKSFVTSGIFTGDITVADCAGVSFIGGGAGACPSTVSACLTPGTYYVVVGMDFDAGATPCGSTTGLNDYVVEVTSTPASCPTLVGATCAAPGPDTAWSNNQVPPVGTNNLGGLVACAANPAFPTCSAGAGTGANKFARVFTSGQLGGEINCFEVGFFSVVRAPNAANTACANYLSDLPLPATVYICRDTDGANPRNIIATAGDGNDLEVLSTRSVLVPGMADTGAINFDPPLCLDGVSGNIVVVLDIPSFLVAQGNIPAAAGYGMRAAGLTVTGQSSQVFIRLSCADAAGQFVSAESLGATFTAQWFVGANGTFAGCASDCAGDFDGDGFVTAADLSTLLGSWGGPGGDIDGDGTTTAADLSALLGAWGACP